MQKFFGRNQSEDCFGLHLDFLRNIFQITKLAIKLPTLNSVEDQKTPALKH